MIHLSAGACSENRAEGAPGAVSPQTIDSNLLEILLFNFNFQLQVKNSDDSQARATGPPPFVLKRPSDC